MVFQLSCGRRNLGIGVRLAIAVTMDDDRGFGG